MQKENLLSAKEIRQIRNSVKTMCANYNRDYDCCALLDDYGCYMLTKRFADNKLCKYFRQAVLPLDSMLEKKLTCQAINQTKSCAVCGASFLPAGRKAYCSPGCQRTGTRIKEREKKRTQRQKGK